MKINIVVTDVVNDVTYSRKSVNTRVAITLLLHDVSVYQSALSQNTTLSVKRNHQLNILYRHLTSEFWIQKHERLNNFHTIYYM